MLVELCEGALASTTTPLDWKSRLNIALNAAQGKARVIFAYIHIFKKILSCIVKDLLIYIDLFTITSSNLVCRYNEPKSYTMTNMKLTYQEHE